tara:strand:- start:7 stop:921 length:915 start_codon:yes stop_codon:yes gene_type:complete
MARHKSIKSAKRRVALTANEGLMEAAASMAGNLNKGLTKSVASSLISGAVGNEAANEMAAKRRSTKKMKRKLKSRKEKIENIKVGPVMKGEKQITGLPKNKKSTNKMKKESAFKMKGFSGFGDGTSPTKKKEINYSDDGTKTVTRTRRDGSVRSKKVYSDYYGKTKLQSKTKYRKSGEVKRTKTKISDTTNKITKTNRKGVTKTMYRDNAKTKAKKLGKFVKNKALPVVGDAMLMGAAGAGLFKAMPTISKVLTGTKLGRAAMGGVASVSGSGILGTAIQGVGAGAKAIGRGIKRIGKRKNRKK